MKTTEKKPGGQPGNTNAMIGEEPLNAQLLVRLPEKSATALKSLPPVTGDRNVNALVRRLIDNEINRVSKLSVRK